MGGKGVGFSRTYSVSENYYGFSLGDNSVIRDRFFEHIAATEKVISRKPEIARLLDEAGVDQLYVMVTELDFDTTFFQRIYLLALAKILCDREKLLFSSFERKYTYLEVISGITNKVKLEIRDNVAKKTLAYFLTITITGTIIYCLYK